jgi:hypothetical protein
MSIQSKSTLGLHSAIRHERDGEAVGFQIRQRFPDFERTSIILAEEDYPRKLRVSLAQASASLIAGPVRGAFQPV